MLTIGSPILTDVGEYHRIEFPTTGWGESNLWFEVSRAAAPLVAPSCDPALVGLLGPAMGAGQPMTIQGPVTNSLRWAVISTVMPVLRRALVGITEVPIRADDQRLRFERTGDAVLTGLSCGVDSLTVCADHLLSAATAPEDRITHFLFNDIGSHGSPGLGDARFQNVSAAASALGLPLIRVRSNLADWYPPWPSSLDFVATHTLRNAAVALLFQGGARRFLYASGAQWELTGFGNWGNISSVEPMVLPVLGTPSLELRCVGQEANRVEKTRKIAGLPIAHRFLDVCIGDPSNQPSPGANCAQCSKCLRTLFTLDLLGHLESFGAVFDLSVYRQNRERYIARLLAGEGRHFRREILDLMRATNFRPRVRHRGEAIALRILKWLRR